MRIIAGEYRGRILHSPHDHSIRPTTDRAKQTIFDVLSSRFTWDGLRVLDLFSGTGSLGLEALSRGCASVTFVEKAATSLKILGKNIDDLQCSDRCTVHQADVWWYLKTARKAFDVVFADPPYRLDQIGELPCRIHDSAATQEGTWVVMEHSRESAMDVRESQYHIIRKPFGQTTVLLMNVLKSPQTEQRV